MRTDFRYSLTHHVPVVAAILEYKGEMLTSAPLRFIIDTGAGHTIITPKLENYLKLNANEIDWDDEFVGQAWTALTLLGPAKFKRLKKPATLWFPIRDDGEQMWGVDLEFLLFAERSPVAGRREVFVLPAKELEYGLLGQDVLTKCGCFIAKKEGFLTPDLSRATQTINDF